MTSIHSTNSPRDTQDDSSAPQAENTPIPSAMLFPLAYVQARLFWVYSVIWTLYSRLSSEDSSTQPSKLQPSSSAQRPVERPCAAVAKISRRSRGQSAPPPTQAPLVDPPQEQRARGSTISTESPSTSTRSGSRAMIPLHNTDLALLRPLPQDERNGTTCPPQWWQKTRFYIDARKHHHQRNRSSSPSLQVPLSSSSSVSMSGPSMLALSRSRESVVDVPPETQQPATQLPDSAVPAHLDPPTPVKRTPSKRKRFLDLLHHHHHHHPQQQSSGKHLFWKKKTGPAPAL
ncbi:hypothetical protein BX666DRAFT_1873848 [Dichotomocladium elegans]|nr:hypothetical protein BX666DRAFT_1873848 [Dichotomocladium elegans]